MSTCIDNLPAFHAGILCVHIGILCMHVGILCMHVGILCMHVGILKVQIYICVQRHTCWHVVPDFVTIQNKNWVQGQPTKFLTTKLRSAVNCVNKE